MRAGHNTRSVAIEILPNELENSITWKEFECQVKNLRKNFKSKTTHCEKKCHTVKNNLIINETCKVVLLTPSFEGRHHDKHIADMVGYCVPQGSTLSQDTGFQGFVLPDINIIQPKKKPRGRERTNEEKENNRKIASIRIRVEHAISGVKRCRIVKDKLRNWKKGFCDLVMETCCGLHNFRLNFRPWRYETPSI